MLIGSRDLDKGEGAANEVGAEAHAVRLDVTDQTTIDAAAERIERQFGRLDVLVNNAGISRASDLDAPLERVARSGRLGRAPLPAVPWRARRPAVPVIRTMRRGGRSL